MGAGTKEDIQKTLRRMRGMQKRRMWLYYTVHLETIQISVRVMLLDF